MGLLTDKLSVRSRGMISLEGVGILNDHYASTLDAVVGDHTTSCGRGCSFRREVALFAHLCISMCIKDVVCLKNVLRFTAEWSYHQRVPASATGSKMRVRIKKGKESADLQTQAVGSTEKF
jgi:hypothetical protein